MAPKRRRDDGLSTSTAQPNYLRSGLLFDPHAPETPATNAPLSSVNRTRHLGVPERKESGVPLKWRIDSDVIPQCVLQHIIQKGTLALRVCALLSGSKATHTLQQALPAERFESSSIEIFPRRLSMLVTKDGKVMQTKDAGLRPTNEVASIDLSTVQPALLFGRDRSVVRKGH
ncbi:Hypothetical protein, putative [Bodo saltans]|uniref:Uncharacterized protein n=1 Tax=Bodo saltans TaxID=75058 RepID=A0A0S4JKM3_BODSA|nr:Hypothetical protein, putative [Bodo saltans]|eukprot:CUG89538.1 Hypothetical protein, putative [Bodo saltans]